MKLIDDVKEAMAVVLDDAGLPQSAAYIREDKEDSWTAIKMARAGLEVLGQYEEVRVRPDIMDAARWYPQGGHYFVPEGDSCFTVLRRKLVPEPTAEETLRGLSDEWKKGAGAGFCDKMAALAKKLDKP